MGSNVTFRMMAALVAVFAGFHEDCLARDPVSNLDGLLEKSDAVVLARVERIDKSNRYSDLNPKNFDEFSVVVEVRSAFKGELKRKMKATVILYRATGRGASGNFGSTLKVFGKDNRVLHLLYLRKRDDTWMPTSGYVDGGNSHFVSRPIGDDSSTEQFKPEPS